MRKGNYLKISNEVITNKRIQPVFPSPEQKENEPPSVWFEQINNNKVENYVDINDFDLQNKEPNNLDIKYKTDEYVNHVGINDLNLQNKEPNKLGMKWTTVEYVNPTDPRVWGPAFWFTLHNGSVNYPIKASPIWAERMKGFILGMPVMIPCEKCRDHATSHIEENYFRLNEIVSGREQLFNFFVSFHNYVNERYNKPKMSIEDAYSLYTSGVNVTKLEY
jgi:hypothetical protein